MTKPINTRSIEKATNKTWDDWVLELEKSGARELSHTDLARKLSDQLEGRVEGHGWWAQSIAVAYEQHIGRRAPGQLANGLFEISVSKTIPAARSEVYKRISAWLESHDEFNGRKFHNARSSSTDKRDNWRCDLEDGSKLTAVVEELSNKTRLVFFLTAIPTKQDAESWKLFWQEVYKADEITFTKQEN